MQVHHGTENWRVATPVVTIGSFDGVHKGHALVIEALEGMAGRMAGESAIVSFEPHPREVLYPMEKRPGILTTLEEKIELLDGYGVDHLIVLPFTRALAELDYKAFVREILVGRIGLKGLVVGYDHRFGKNREGTFEKLKELSAICHFEVEQEAAYEENRVNVSSTKIRDALQTGNVSQASEFLGYDYALSGEVVEGDKIGRSIGFPTANIRLDDERKLLPASGVYAVRAFVDGEEHKGMLNIGVRPTVSSSGAVRIEVHLLGFGRDIYGSRIRVALKARIRGERKFNDTDELRRQLVGDRMAVEAALS